MEPSFNKTAEELEVLPGDAWSRGVWSRAGSGLGGAWSGGSGPRGMLLGGGGSAPGGYGIRACTEADPPGQNDRHV